MPAFNVNAFQSKYGGGFFDAFVTKVNSNGTALIYSSFLGGNDADSGSAIAVDSSGAAYLTGETFSTNFPSANAFQPALILGSGDAFVTKISDNQVTFGVSGFITDTNGIGLAGISVAVSGPKSGTTPSGSNGYYSAGNLTAGDYTITPSSSSHVFSPASITFNSISANQTANFTASATPPATPTPTPTPTVQLLLDSSGPDPNQAVALDSELFLRDPFSLVDAGNLLNQGTDRNTRVMIFVAGIQLLPADTIVVNLVDNQNQTYDVTPEDVRLVPDQNFYQIVFRLPNTLPAGACLIRVSVPNRSLTSNGGIIRIKI